MAKNRTKELLGVFVLFIIMVVLLLIRGHFSSSHYFYLLNEGGRAVCKITTIHTKTVEVTYMIKDKVYKKRVPNKYCVYAIDEEYEMWYNPKNFLDIIVLDTHPIIPKNIELASTYTKKIEYINILGNNFAKFYYEVNGEEYLKARSFTKKMDIDESKSYLVKYNPDNPQMAYLFLDKSK